MQGGGARQEISGEEAEKLFCPTRGSLRASSPPLGAWGGFERREDGSELSKPAFHGGSVLSKFGLLKEEGVVKEGRLVLAKPGGVTNISLKGS